MPDDKVIDEQELDQDAVNAFDEDEEESESKSEEDESEGEDKKEDEGEEKEDKNKEDKEDKSESAKDRLEKHLSEMEDEKKDDDKEDDKEDKDDKEDDKDDKAKSKIFTKEDIANRINSIKIEDLPGEVIIGDDSVNLQEFAKDEPEMFAAVKVLSSKIAEDLVGKAIADLQKSFNFPVKDEVYAEIDKLGSMFNQFSFNYSIASLTDDNGNIKYPTYLQDRTKIQEWAIEQAKSDPKKAKLLSSFDLKDATLGLDFYYESIAHDKVKKHKDKKQKEKEEYDNLNSDTGGKRSSRKRSESDNRAPDEISEEAFNED